MEKLTSKLGMGEKLKKNFITVLLVASGGTIIYLLPYFRFDYYDAYMEVYNLTNTQMGTFGSIFGVFGMISYFFGGYVADRFPTRYVLSVSLILTGIGGFLHLLPLSYGALLVLYSVWGFTSLFAFWPACIKAVRILSDPSDSGKGYGIFEGARGIVAAIMAPLAVLAFSIGVKNSLGDVQGMRYVIIFYSIVTVLSGIFIFIKMDNQKISVGKSEGEKIRLKDLGTVLKLPEVWIIGMVTFCNYVFCLSLYYFTPYATSLLGASIIFGASLAAAKRWISPVANIGGGFLADKVGTSKLLFISFIVMGVGTAAILLLPLNTSKLAVFTILFIVIYFFYNVNSSISWAMMEEGKIPVRFSGTAAGFISTLGYLPEIFISLFAGKTLDTYPGVTGYRYFFGFLIAMMALGAIFVLIWKRHLEKILLKQKKLQVNFKLEIAPDN